MTDIILNTEVFGYTTDNGGFSGVFSWWRNFDKFGLWYVCGHIDGFTSSLSSGVTDDFGNIVKVPS